jgi:hypothetical protein
MGNRERAVLFIVYLQGAASAGLACNSSLTHAEGNETVLQWRLIGEVAKSPADDLMVETPLCSGRPGELY